jgi:GGDEF domain-containing protein
VNTFEIVIWSAMLGALLTMAVVAAADALRTGSLPAWRGLAFVVLTGGSAVLLTGLPEQLLGITDPRFLLPAKLGIGPMAGALALTYQGNWLGVAMEDRLLRWMIAGGAGLIVAGTSCLLLAYMAWPAVPAQQWLLMAAGLNMLPALFALMAGVRGVVLGDMLARWMALSCLSLTVMLVGLYAKALGWRGGNALWLLTAVTTIAFFLIVTTLTLVRNIAQKRLQRLARGTATHDETTGLPIGATLLTKVDDAFWRSARVGRDSAVVALWVNNMYALHEEAGHDVEHEIRMRLTAVLRRAAGFRHVVGLAQVRCFVVVVSVTQGPNQVAKLAERLLIAVNKPMQVGALQGTAFEFTPDVGIGVLNIPTTAHGDALVALDKAQELAKAAQGLRERLVYQSIDATVYHGG